MVLMPHDSPQLKVEATKEYGGNIIHFDRYNEDREELADQLSAQRGMTIIPPGNHPDVIAG